jgi:antitoxin YefM
MVNIDVKYRFMKTTTITDFRSKMKERLQEIEDDQDILILSGPKKRDFVILTLDQFNSMEETAHLLSTPNNTARLMESIGQDRAGNVTVREFESDKKQEKVHKGKSAVVKKKR